MHELGHNLGLKHGGSDHLNCKPNYLSVMNYAFQHPIISPGRKLDFSRNQLMTLNELSLDETIGVASPQVVNTVYGVPVESSILAKAPQIGSVPETIVWKAKATSASLPIDWNYSCAGSPSCVFQQNVSANVNRIDVIDACKDRQGLEPYTILNGHNDWASTLIYSPRQIPVTLRNLFGSPDGQREMTFEEVIATAESADYDGTGSRMRMTIVPIFNPNQSDTDGNGIGDGCEVPLIALQLL